jgi:hypothetical protein
MTEKIDAPVSVRLNFDHDTGKSYPRAIIWNNRLYPVLKVGLHHKFREGRTLYHVFSVISNTLFFRLIFDTDSLGWKLEEISDKL